MKRPTLYPFSLISLALQTSKCQSIWTPMTSGLIFLVAEAAPGSVFGSKGYMMCTSCLLWRALIPLAGVVTHAMLYLDTIVCARSRLLEVSLKLRHRKKQPRNMCCHERSSSALGRTMTPKAQELKQCKTHLVILVIRYSHGPGLRISQDIKLLDVPNQILLSS